MSSSPRKKLKTDFGPVETLDGEQRHDKRKHAERTASVDDHSPALNVSISRSFLSLNDDCLIAIAERSNIMDLWSIARSSERLSEIVFQMFKRKYKTLKFIFSDYVSVKEAFQFKRLFATFGRLIIELEINFKELFPQRADPNAVIIIDSVTQFCSALKSLKLAKFDIPDNQNSFVGMGKLFGRLKTLQLQYVYIEGINYWHRDQVITENENRIYFFDNCESLTKLKIVESHFFHQAIFDNSFPRLEHFLLEHPDGWSNSSIDGFITRHPNIQTFGIDWENSHSHVPFVATSCKNLQILGFRFEEDTPTHISASIKCLATFQNLRVVVCSRILDNMSELVQTLPNSLEMLQLSHGRGSQDVIRIISSNMKKLKVFRMYEIFVQDRMNLNLLAELTELKVLSLHFRTEGKKILTFDLVKVVINWLI